MIKCLSEWLVESYRNYVVINTEQQIVLVIEFEYVHLLYTNMSSWWLLFTSIYVIDGIVCRCAVSKYEKRQVHVTINLN